MRPAVDVDAERGERLLRVVVDDRGHLTGFLVREHVADQPDVDAISVVERVEEDPEHFSGARILVQRFGGVDGAFEWLIYGRAVDVDRPDFRPGRTLDRVIGSFAELGVAAGLEAVRERRVDAGAFGQGDLRRQQPRVFEPRGAWIERHLDVDRRRVRRVGVTARFHVDSGFERNFVAADGADCGCERRSVGFRRFVVGVDRQGRGLPFFTGAVARHRQVGAVAGAAVEDEARADDREAAFGRRLDVEHPEDHALIDRVEVTDDVGNPGRSRERDFRGHAGRRFDVEDRNGGANLRAFFQFGGDFHAFAGSRCFDRNREVVRTNDHARTFFAEAFDREAGRGFGLFLGAGVSGLRIHVQAFGEMDFVVFDEAVGEAFEEERGATRDFVVKFEVGDPEVRVPRSLAVPLSGSRGEALFAGLRERGKARRRGRADRRSVDVFFAGQRFPSLDAEFGIRGGGADRENDKRRQKHQQPSGASLTSHMCYLSSKTGSTCICLPASRWPNRTACSQGRPRFSGESYPGTQIGPRCFGSGIGERGPESVLGFADRTRSLVDLGPELGLGSGRPRWPPGRPWRGSVQRSAAWPPGAPPRARPPRGTASTSAGSSRRRFPAARSPGTRSARTTASPRRPPARSRPRPPAGGRHRGRRTGGTRARSSPSARALDRLAQSGEAGLSYQDHSGSWFAYFARLAPA